jgi:hypothetical protein
LEEGWKGSCKMMGGSLEWKRLGDGRKVGSGAAR